MIAFLTWTFVSLHLRLLTLFQIALLLILIGIRLVMPAIVMVRAIRPVLLVRAVLLVPIHARAFPLPLARYMWLFLPSRDRKRRDVRHSACCIRGFAFQVRSGSSLLLRESLLLTCFICGQMVSRLLWRSLSLKLAVSDVCSEPLVLEGIHFYD